MREGSPEPRKRQPPATAQRGESHADREAAERFQAYARKRHRRVREDYAARWFREPVPDSGAASILIAALALVLGAACVWQVVVWLARVVR